MPVERLGWLAPARQLYSLQYICHRQSIWILLTSLAASAGNGNNVAPNGAHASCTDVMICEGSFPSTDTVFIKVSAQVL